MLREGLLRGKRTPSPSGARDDGGGKSRRRARPRRTSVRALSSSCASPGRAGAAANSGAAGEEASPGPGPPPRPRPPARAPRAPGTGELLDGEAVEDLEGGVELQRLAAPLAHEADLRGAGARPGRLHAAAQPRARPAIAARRT